MRHAFNCFCSRCQARRIQAKNDKFRKEILTDANNDEGKCSITQGVHILPPDAKMAIFLAVRNYDTFNPEDGDDPYGEHDFGAVELPNLPKVFWKIDYYESEACDYGTEDRLNAYRVLLIMLADEY